MTRQELQEQKTGLIAYLLSKVKANDFHVVQDVASYICEIDAKLEVLTELQTATLEGSMQEVSRYNISTDRYEFSDGTPDLRLPI